MIPAFRAVLAGCAVLSLASPLPLSAQNSPASTKGGRSAAAPVWPPTHSDIRPEPSARFGQLDNGVRYVIMHNATPPHQTSIRMRIGSGSLEEADNQQGLAHFLEHMAFKGSAHMPEGEMMKVLERHGLAFGADTNAFTSFDQTIYQLDLPESDEETLGLGLMLMRETASELTIDAKAMEPERGVVLSEERVRDTPSYEAAKKQQSFIMQGQLAPTRWPIGMVEVIQHAPASRLRDFYLANYRPERTILIVVGDIDVDKVEAKIKARFSDWRASGPGTAEPIYGQVAKRGVSAHVTVQPGLPTTVSATWVGAYDAAPDNRAKEERETIETLGLSIVNHRLQRLARSDKPPFLSAGVGRANQLHTLRAASLFVTPAGSDWQGALLAADGVRREVLRGGITQAELDRALKETRERLHGAVAGVGTRQTPALAAEILADIGSEEVFTTPMENLSIFEDAVRGLKTNQVDAALAQTFTGQGPLITLISPSEPKGGEDGLITAFNAAEAAPLKTYETAQTKIWPYASFGAPGIVVEKHVAPDLGLTFVRFANGVKLIFKHTDFRRDQVEVAYNLAGGLLTLPSDHKTAIWASAALTQGAWRK